MKKKKKLLDMKQTTVRIPTSSLKSFSESPSQPLVWCFVFCRFHIMKFKNHGPSIGGSGIQRRCADDEFTHFSTVRDWIFCCCSIWKPLKSCGGSSGRKYAIDWNKTIKGCSDAHMPAHKVQITLWTVDYFDWLWCWFSWLPGGRSHQHQLQ